MRVKSRFRQSSPVFKWLDLRLLYRAIDIMAMVGNMTGDRSHVWPIVIAIPPRDLP